MIYLVAGKFEAPAYFQPVIHTYCKCEYLPREVFVVPSTSLVRGIHPRFNYDRFIPGFPSTRHLPHKVMLIVSMYFKGTILTDPVCVMMCHLVVVTLFVNSIITNMLLQRCLCYHHCCCNSIYANTVVGISSCSESIVGKLAKMLWPENLCSQVYMECLPGTKEPSKETT